jgi:hypothetical protein
MSAREDFEAWWEKEGWGDRGDDKDIGWDAWQAARRTVSGQEAIGEVRGNGVQWFDQNPHAYPVGTKFYAAPIPATEPKEPK